VAVKALDKVWHLHKVYLSQSPYFYRMFNGSWQEAQPNFIEITILDGPVFLNRIYICTHINFILGNVFFILIFPLKTKANDKNRKLAFM